MLSQRVILVCAALVPLVHGTGCSAGRHSAGAAPPAQWVRDTLLDPWRPLGVSPNANWIEHALREVAVYETLEECPLRLLKCGRPRAAPEALDVDDVRCVAVAQSMDRCSFRLTETRLDGSGGGSRSVRSRCIGHFVPMGSSHALWQWGIETWDVPPFSCTPNG